MKEEEYVMEERVSKYKQVVVGVDESNEAAHTFKKALDVALSEGSKLLIVSAVPYVPEVDVINTTIELGMPPSLTPGIEYDEVIKARKEFIQKYVDEAKAAGVKDVDILVEADSPKNLILDALDDFTGCLIVVGASSKKPFERFMVGSTAKHVVAKAPCNVLVVKSYL